MSRLFGIAGIFCIFFFLIRTSLCFGQQHYLDITRPDDTGDGTSWATAYKSLSNAVAKMPVSGVTNLWVAQGSYEVANVDIKTNSIFGGYPAGGGTRDWSNNLTIFDGNFTNRALQKTVAGIAVLDGLIVQNGTNSANGGGLNCTAGSLNIYNCIFTNNLSGNSGGAIYHNYAGANNLFSNCTFIANISVTGGFGGAIYFNSQSTNIFRSCTFVTNSAPSTGSGGAIWGAAGGLLQLTSCTFLDNVCGGNGGAILWQGTLDLSYGNDFCGNLSTNGFGGAIYNNFAGTHIFKQSAFVKNSAKSGGGIYLTTTSACFLINCTFFTNTAKTAQGGAIMSATAGSILNITNCIFWGNTSFGTGTNIQNAGTVNIAYSDINTNGNWIAGGTKNYGAGVINVNPLFVGGYDIHEQSQNGTWTGSGWTNWAMTSPCIDGGDPMSDFSNEPIPNGSIINMGRYGNTPEASKSVPPVSPAIYNDIVNPITSNSALLWFNLSSTGLANIALYYGTNDGGTVKANWQTNLFMAGINGPVVASNWANGLLPSQLYFYRAYASNAAGESWSPLSTNFTTSGGGSLPTVNIGGATGITSTNAMLNGGLASFGSDTSSWVRIYWGVSNGLAVEANWASFADLGLRTNTGPFSINITGLITNTVYYYRTWASNSAGRIWSGTVSNFATTGGGSPPTIWNGMINPVTSNSALLWFNLASSGTTDVRLCYGTTDGGTTLGNWQTNLFMGGINGPVVASNWANGLLPSTTYYYRAYASNAFGSAWAPVTTNFVTGSGAGVTRYVSLSGANIAPYTDFANAATNIQTAIDACSDGDTVLVDNGTYYISSQIVVTKAITMLGINGAAVTIIDGGLLTRCLFVDNPGAVVGSFTLTHGKTFAFSDYGGGVLVSNGLVKCCTIWANESFDTGGGAGCYSNAILEDCLVVSNVSHYGGGVYLGGGLMRNCTVVDNVATTSGGGGVVIDLNGEIWNSILYNNQGGSLGTNYCVNSGSINYSCIFPDYDPAPAGTGNIFVDPLFAGPGNYTPQPGSPCIDSGSNQLWMGTAWDLDGVTRIMNGIVDRGCFESTTPPPPSVNNDGGASNVTANTAFLRGNLVSGGGTNGAWVTMYWGMDSNNWANTNSLGYLNVGPFSTNITGLTTNTTYYYRCYASNAFGSAWAPNTANFMTPANSLGVGLVAYYPFNGNASDESGNGNDGTVNASILTSDRFGNANSAYYFDGDSGGNGNSYISAADSPSLSVTSTVTFSAWACPSNNSAVILKKGIYLENGSYYIYGANYAQAGVTRSDNNQFMAQITETMPDGHWYNLVGTYDGAVLRLYINGQLTNSVALSGSIRQTSSPLYIGFDSGSPGGHFGGLIDDIRIYNRALSSNEVLQLYQFGDVDSDFDGMPDWWELQYFGGLSQLATGNPDSDGFTNLQEYQNGTNPTVPNGGSLSVVTLPAFGIMTNSAFFSGQVLSTGGGTWPYITFYWGTSDCGSNSAAWENTNSIGMHDVGVFSNFVAGLSTDTTVYYYRIYASNNTGTAWSPSAESFGGGMMPYQTCDFDLWPGAPFGTRGDYSNGNWMITGTITTNGPPNSLPFAGWISTNYPDQLIAFNLSNGVSEIVYKMRSLTGFSTNVIELQRNTTGTNWITIAVMTNSSTMWQEYTNSINYSSGTALRFWRATQPLSDNAGDVGFDDILVFAYTGGGPQKYFKVYFTYGEQVVQTNQHVSLTVEAWDGASLWTGYTGTVHFTAWTTNCTLPSDYTFKPGDGGVRTFTNGVSFGDWGDQFIEVWDNTNGMQSGQSIFVCNGYGSVVQRLWIGNWQDPVMVGEWSSFYVAAIDSNGGLVTNYTGQVIFSSSDGSASLPVGGSANYTFTVLDAGIHSFSNNLRFNAVGEHWLKVQDSINTNLYDKIWNFTAKGYGTGTGVTHFVLSDVDHYVWTNEWYDLHIEARDQYENIFEGFTGTVLITSSDPSAIYPSNCLFTPGDYGTRHFNNAVQMRTLGTQMIEARWQVNTNIMGGIYGIEVAPEGYECLEVFHNDNVIPGFTLADRWLDVTVKAWDALGNIDSNFTGTVLFSSEDPSTFFALTNYTFTIGDSGVHVFSNLVRYASPGEYSIKVEQQGLPFKWDMSEIYVLMGGATNTASFYVESVPYPFLSNTWHDVFVLALGDDGRVNTNFSGNIEFVSSDPLVQVAIPVFNSFVNGMAYITNQVSPRTPGDHMFRAQLQSDTNIGNSANIMVLGGGTYYYVNGSTGSDTNNGLSAGTAWKTIGRAMTNALAAGDVVIVGPSVYNESVNIGVSGSPNKFFTIFGDQEGRYFGGNSKSGTQINSGDAPAFNVSGQSYVAICNFDITDNSSTTGIVVQGGSNVRLVDINIHNRLCGIEIDNSTQNVIIDSDIGNCSMFGVHVKGASHGLVVKDMYVDDSGAGLKIDGGVTNALISHNIFVDNIGGGINISNTTCIIELNDIEGGAYGINVLASSVVEIRNNIIYGAGSDGISFLNAGAGCIVRQNTVAYNGSIALNVNNTPGMDIRNNIFAFNTNSGLYADPASTNGMINSYNCSFGNTINWSGSATAGAGSISVDPMFAANPIQNCVDGHLKSQSGRITAYGWTNDIVTSPCIDAGDPALPWMNELMPNGGRANMGFDGNLKEASRTFFITHSITVFNSDPNGLITPTGTIEVIEGSNFVFTITPSNNYHVGTVNVDAIPIGETNSYTFTNVTSSHSISATFTLNSYDVTASNVVNGSIMPTGTMMVTHGNMQPYTITADPNYHVVDVWIDGTNNIGPTNNFTFMNVTNGGHTIYATFAIDTYTLDVTSPFGMPTPAGLTTNNWNASINAYLAGSPTNYGSTQYVCTGWFGTGSAGSGPGTNTSFNITMNSALNWMWSSNYWLATTSAPNGYVDVSSMWVQASSNVMIQAYPSNGYHFLNWTGDITTNMNPLNIFMSQPYSVQANFELNSYDIMASPPVNGSVSPSGTVWVGHGSNMTFTITPDTNYHVLNVTIDGTNSIGATNSYTFMNVTNGGHSVNVTFAIDEFSLSVTSDHGAPTPSGLTSNVWNFFISPSVSTPVPDGAYTQYVCKGWVGSGSVPATGNTNSFGFNLTSNSTLTWLWETDYYFNANAGANGGVDVMSDWKLAGSNFNITATPSNGYHFVNWTGDISSTNNPLSITMTQGYLITANFAINTYDVTASNVVNGSIMPTGTMMVTHGSSQPYTITPSSNYHVVNVWIDGTNNIGPTNNFTFMNVTNGGHTIYATFAPDTCTLNVTSPFGSPIPSGLTTNNWNDMINAYVLGSPYFNGATQYICTGWTGSGSVLSSGSGTGMAFNITMNSSIDWQWSSNYWLATTSAPNGYVDVSSMWVGSGSNILVTAYPSNGYQFSGWTGSIVTNINPLNVIMTAPQNIQANFIITSNDIMVSAGPDGNITPSGTQWVPYGGNLNFAITPNPNYHVLDVLVDGSSVGAVTNYNFTNVTNARTISASFAIDTYTLNVSSLYDSPTPSGLTTNNWNSLINAFVASSVMNGAVTQFVCTGWSGTGSTPLSGTSNSFSFNLTNNSTLTWNWKTQYYFNAMAVGMGSVITTNGWCDRGSLISATAVPTNGYTFNGWTGDIVTNTPTVTPTMNQSFDLTANFTIIQYNITASAGAGGMISPAGTNLVNYGNNLGFTVMPNANYHIVSVTIDGTNNIGATNSYTFINVTNNHTISATFAIDTYGLVVTSPYGTPTPGLGTNIFNYGATTTCFIAGSPVTMGTTQYVAIGWTGSGNIVGGSGANTGPIIITQNSSINWSWNAMYFLTCSSGSTNGSVDVTNGWYNSGNMAMITATPNGGFVFGGWTGDVPVSNAMDNPLNLTMDQARSVTATFVPPMGNVQVNLSPVAAITNGAQWRLTGGPDTNWHASGFIVTNVPVGGSPYTVTFNTVSGFTKPLDKTDVMVTDGATTVRAGNYMVGSMALIPAGSFNMGGSGGPLINISSFYLDTREVTVGEYQWFCTSAPSTMPPAPPWGWGNTNLPMCNLTWNEAAGYAAWAGKRLPTEAEFEYAMRGGAPNNLYPWGNTIAPSDANYGNTNGPVLGMGYSANGYGLYDVSGNVWEWCNDWYGGFISAPATDPQGAGSGTYKMIRGGSYVNSTIALQCASRYFTTPTVRHLDTGFRCASTMGLIGGGATPDDANNNGIPEWWEQYYFGLAISGGTPFDPTADLDGDGLNNAQEYAAGTDPTSASSVLALTSPSNSVPYGFVVSWNSVAGKYYIIERCVKLTDGFSSIATNIPATYPMNTYTDTVSGADCYYYKVKVQP